MSQRRLAWNANKTGLTVSPHRVSGPSRTYKVFPAAVREDALTGNDETSLGESSSGDERRKRARQPQVEILEISDDESSVASGSKSESMSPEQKKAMADEAVRGIDFDDDEDEYGSQPTPATPTQATPAKRDKGKQRQMSPSEHEEDEQPVVKHSKQSPVSAKRARRIVSSSSSEDEHEPGTSSRPAFKRLRRAGDRATSPVDVDPVHTVNSKEWQARDIGVQTSPPPPSDLEMPHPPVSPRPMSASPLPPPARTASVTTRKAAARRRVREASGESEEEDLPSPHQAAKRGAKQRRSDSARQRKARARTVSETDSESEERVVARRKRKGPATTRKESAGRVKAANKGKGKAKAAPKQAKPTCAQAKRRRSLSFEVPDDDLLHLFSTDSSADSSASETVQRRGRKSRREKSGGRDRSKSDESEERGSSPSDGGEVEDEDLEMSGVEDVEEGIKRKVKRGGRKDFSALRQARETRGTQQSSPPINEAEGSGSSSDGASGASGSSSDEADFIVDDDEDGQGGEELEDLRRKTQLRSLPFKSHVENFMRYLVYLVVCPRTSWYEDEEDFKVAVDRVNQAIQDRLNALITSMAWRPAFRHAIQSLPELAVEDAHDRGGPCYVCTMGSDRKSESSIRLFGSKYDRHTFESLEVFEEDGTDANETSSDAGVFCRSRAESYHALRHWPWATYQTVLPSIEARARELDHDKVFGTKRRRDMVKLAKLAGRVVDSLEREGWTSMWASALEREMDTAVRAFANEKS